MTMDQQLVVMRIRIRDYEAEINKLSSPHRQLTNIEERLRLSLQAQLQDDRTKLRKVTGEL